MVKPFPFTSSTFLAQTMQQPGEDFIISPNTSYSLLMKDILSCFVTVTVLQCVILQHAKIFKTFVEFPNEISLPPRKHPRGNRPHPLLTQVLEFNSSSTSISTEPSDRRTVSILLPRVHQVRSNQLAVANTLVRWRYSDFWCFTVKKTWKNLITWDLPLRWLFGLAPAIETILDDFVWSYWNINSMRLTYRKHSCIKEKCNMTYTDTVPLWACYRDRKNTHTTAYFSKLGRSVEGNTCTHWRIPAI